MTAASVAVLGTLADFHREPIPYDLSALFRLVEQIQPDLLCLDLTPQEWKTQDFANLPPEYVEALMPLAQQTDIVVVPVADDRPPEEAGLQSSRAVLADWIRRGLAFLQRTAPSATAINQGVRHHLANLLYDGLAALHGKEARETSRVHAHQLAWNVVQTARRDPGRRILVVVNVRFCHYVRRILRVYLDMRVVPFLEL